MIRKECLKDDHLDAVAKQLKVRERPLLGKMVHALYLVEQLTLHGLQFTFKGGTCLSLVVDRLDRLSIDVDIEVYSDTSIQDVEEVLNRIVSEGSVFVSWKLQTRRSSREGSIHYLLHYQQPHDVVGGNMESVLLDVVTTSVPNPLTERRALEHMTLINDGEPVMIVTPTLEGLLGDKLTACAPLTVGVPIHSSIIPGTDRQVNKHQQMIKQLHDVNILIPRATSWENVGSAFGRAIEVQREVFGQSYDVEEVAMDLINRALALFGQFDGEYHPDLDVAHQGGHRSLSNYIIRRRNFEFVDVKMAALRSAYVGHCIIHDRSLNTMFKDVTESKLSRERIKSICKGLPKDVKGEAVTLVEILVSENANAR